MTIAVSFPLITEQREGSHFQNQCSCNSRSQGKKFISDPTVGFCGNSFKNVRKHRFHALQGDIDKEHIPETEFYASCPPYTLAYTFGNPLLKHVRALFSTPLAPFLLPEVKL